MPLANLSTWPVFQNQENIKPLIRQQSDMIVDTDLSAANIGHSPEDINNNSQEANQEHANHAANNNIHDEDAPMCYETTTADTSTVSDNFLILPELADTESPSRQPKPIDEIAPESSSNFNEIDLSAVTKPNHPHPDCSQFMPLRLLGRGSFATVFLVKKLYGPDKGTLYAMKILRKAKLRFRDRLRSQKERDILVDVKHPFIVNLNYAFQTEGKLLLILDFVRGGDLFTRLNSEVMFTEEDVKFYLAESLLALTHLHSLGIIYRDFKPENILLEADGHIKLTDFGLSKESLNDDKTFSFCGTVEYMSPEIINRHGHTRSADFWSLAVVMFEMLTGTLPFQGANRKETMQQIVKARLTMPPYISPGAQDLLRQLFKRVPTNRLGAGSRDGHEIMEHNFFSSIDFKLLYDKKVAPPYTPSVPLDSAYELDSERQDWIEDSPGLPASANAKELFRGFSFVAPSLAKQCSNLEQFDLQREAASANVTAAGLDGATRLTYKPHQHHLACSQQIVQVGTPPMISGRHDKQKHVTNHHNTITYHHQHQHQNTQTYSSQKPTLLTRKPTTLSGLSTMESHHKLLKDFEVKGLIASGSFSRCFKVVKKSDGIVYACKVIDKYKKDCQDEIEILMRFGNHPNIVNLHQVFEDLNHTYLIMEYLGGGELLDLILSRKYLTEREASSILEVIATAVKYLHDNGVVHRDLKPSNIMYSNSDDPKSIKICDLGFAKQMRAENGLLMTPCFTANWVAPEVLMEQGYDKACDVWSLGVLLYTMLAGHTPFACGDETSPQKILQRIGTGRVDMTSGNWRNISPQAKDLVQRMLHADPKRRIRISDVLAHIWITDRNRLPNNKLTHGELWSIKQNVNKVFNSLNIRVDFKLKTIDMSNIARRRLEKNNRSAKYEFNKVN